MGLKDGSSAIVGVPDVAYLMEAFEEVNSCTLSLSMVGKRKDGRCDLLMTVTAHTIPSAAAGRALLASSDMFLLDSGYSSFGSAIMWALYLVDGQLADKEMKGKIDK